MYLIVHIRKKVFFFSFLLSSYPTSFMNLYSDESAHQNAFDEKKTLSDSILHMASRHHLQ